MSVPLKELLQRHDLSVVDLARHLGVDPSTVSHKLSGRRGWSAPEAVEVMAYLRNNNVRSSYADLFGGSAVEAAVAS